MLILKSRAKIWLKLLNWVRFHACMVLLLSFELFSWKLLHACSYFWSWSMDSPCFCKNWLFEACFRSFEFIRTHACMSFASIFMLLDFGLELYFNWTTFGLWFCKFIFEACHIMSFKVFSRILAQKDQIWCFKVEFWAWRFNLEISEFGPTLERGTPCSSVHSEYMKSARA